VSQDDAGLLRLFRQFSSPGGIPSHVSVTTPGSIHEGGELGYVLVHAFGAVMDNPDLLAVAVVGDGEAETGPLGGRLEGRVVPQPGARRRGPADPAPQRAKISGPTVLARKDPAEVRSLLAGHGYDALESRARTCRACTTASRPVLAEAWARSTRSSRPLAAASGTGAGRTGR